MATEKAPTREEFLEALKKKGINNLEDLADALMPETGGYRSIIRSNSFLSFFRFWADLAEENDWPEIKRGWSEISEEHHDLGQ